MIEGLVNMSPKLMKKVILFGLVFTFTLIILTACSNSNSVNSGQVVNTQQNSAVYDYKSTWELLNTLTDHFDRHGADFAAKTEEEYAKMAHEFFLNRNKFLVKIDTDGTIRVYDEKTDTFGSYNADGYTKTFFKPNSPGYWERQPGKPPGGN
jgi:hypothetical protein